MGLFKNASYLATGLAEGIHLYAVVQNTPMRELKGSQQEKAWHDWCRKYPDHVKQVQQLQYDLLDMALNIDRCGDNYKFRIVAL